MQCKELVLLFYFSPHATSCNFSKHCRSIFKRGIKWKRLCLSVVSHFANDSNLLPLLLPLLHLLTSILLFEWSEDDFFLNSSFLPLSLLSVNKEQNTLSTQLASLSPSNALWDTVNGVLTCLLHPAQYELSSSYFFFIHTRCHHTFSQNRGSKYCSVNTLLRQDDSVILASSLQNKTSFLVRCLPHG